MRIETAVAVAALLCVAAAKPAGKAKSAKTEKKTMDAPVLEWKSQQGGRPEEGVVVADDYAAWTKVWKELGQTAPGVDFKKYVGVVVFVGEKPTGGFTVVFQEPVAKGDDSVVRYTVPKPGGFVTQAFTHPWKAKAFPRPKGKLIVEAAAQ
ncbi:MAG: protease complex subunit PrcB family protein [Elusimicrobia bacterium]|nr:protease complex subunit PrcB family protein [Elusimicrobiota bacterium]